MSKNYIGFVNDHSGSMGGLAEAAITCATKPTKSPIPKTPKVNQVFFETREDARFYCRNQGISQTLIKDYGRDAANGRRWAVQA